MMNLLIVSHAPSANTREMTGAVVRGADHPGIGEVTVRVLTPFETNAQEVMWAHGLILGTTENFGYMSGAMKDFFDRIYYPCLEQTESLPYGLFIRAGNDGLGARSSIERITKGLGWKLVQEPVICRGNWNEDFPDRCEELGTTMAAGLEAGIF
jgi:multimeric flavodoxin WrbA